MGDVKFRSFKTWSEERFFLSNHLWGGGSKRTKRPQEVHCFVQRSTKTPRLPPCTFWWHAGPSHQVAPGAAAARALQVSTFPASVVPPQAATNTSLLDLAVQTGPVQTRWEASGRHAGRPFGGTGHGDERCL